MRMLIAPVHLSTQVGLRNQGIRANKEAADLERLEQIRAAREALRQKKEDEKKRKEAAAAEAKNRIAEKMAGKRKGGRKKGKR